MRKLISTLSFGLLMFVYVSYSQAAPIQLGEADFFSQISGSSILVEDFESYALDTTLAGPVVLANGTYHGGSLDSVRIMDADWCPDGSQCMVPSGNNGDKRTFDALPFGTNYWGTQIGFVSSSDTFQVTAVGATETLNLQFKATTDPIFLGFYDALGITQIDIQNLGTDYSGGSMSWGNYGFDNITTASTAPVPEPATMLLLSAGLLGLAGFKRRFIK